MAPRRKILKISLIVFLILLAAFFFYFPSYSRYRELKSEAEHLDAKLKDLQKQVFQLQQEKQLLKNDKNYLETVIRKELGLVKPGEVVYEFEKKPRSRKQTADDRPQTGDKPSAGVAAQSPSKT